MYSVLFYHKHLVKVTYLDFQQSVMPGKSCRAVCHNNTVQGHLMHLKAGMHGNSHKDKELCYR